MMTQTDELVAAYLARVERAASRLPAARREELLGDLREHIEIARAQSEAVTEAQVRTILDRLGDPESIVAAADTQTDLPPAGPATPPPPAGYPPIADYPPHAGYPPHPGYPSHAGYPPPPPMTPGSGLRVLWLSLAGLAVLALLAFCLGTALFGVRNEAPAEPAPVATVPAERPEEPTP